MAILCWTVKCPVCELNTHDGGASNKSFIQLFDALYANSINVMLSRGKNALIPIKLQCINSLVVLFGSLEEFMEVLVNERERERDRRRRKLWRVKMFIDFLFIFRREFNDLMILDMTCH